MKIDNAGHSFDECDICFMGIKKAKSKTPNPLNPNAPDILRFALNNKDDYDLIDSKCCFDELKICDNGNIKSIKSLMPKLKSQKLFIMGGEHSIALDCFSELKSFIPDLHLIVFDAHLDMRDDWEENACFLKKIINKFGAKGIHLIGQRVFSKEEHEFMEKNGMKIYEDFSLKGKKIYISFDIDAIDSIYVPTCSTPEPFGKSLKHYSDLLEKIISENELIAIDFNEFSGKSFDITYSNIAGIIMQILKALKRKPQKKR